MSNKVLNFFTGVLRAITGANFGNPFFVLQDIASGKIGARQRDVVRGLVSTGLFEDIAEIQRGKATGVDKVPEEPTAQEEEEKTAPPHRARKNTELFFICFQLCVAFCLCWVLLWCFLFC